MAYKDPEKKRVSAKTYRANNLEKVRAYHRAYAKQWRAAHPRAVQDAKKSWRAAHKEEIKTKQKIWRDANIERITTYIKVYRETYPDKVRASSKAYYSTHAEERRMQSKAWYDAHPGANSAQSKAWRITHPQYDKTYRALHPEKKREKDLKRRARKHNAPLNDLTYHQWRSIQEAQNHCCAYCGKRCKGKLTQDHITPLSKGGSHTLHNVVGACMSCNAKKGPRDPLSPAQPLLLVPL